MKYLALILAVAGAAPASADVLPGTLYFVQDGALAKRVGGTVVTGFTDVGAPVFPSQLALPDGRLVGIASKGDGEPGSEQLVLIGPETKVERIGPATTQVRNPGRSRAGKGIVIRRSRGPTPSSTRSMSPRRSRRVSPGQAGQLRTAHDRCEGDRVASSRDGDSEISTSSTSRRRRRSGSPHFTRTTGHRGRRRMARRSRSSRSHGSRRFPRRGQTARSCAH